MKCPHNEFPKFLGRVSNLAYVATAIGDKNESFTSEVDIDLIDATSNVKGTNFVAKRS